MSNAVCVALDVGYGFTKCAFRESGDQDPVVLSFPSLAPLADDMRLDGGVLRHRNTRRANIDGTTYEIGPDVHLVSDGHRKVVHADYVTTPEYRALVAGALRLAGLDDVDLLVVGLPVSQMSAQQTTLKRSLTGVTVHVDDHVVRIREVLVLAQPVGALIDLASSAAQYERLRKQVNLVIDPGYFTTDWIVAHGLHPVSTRCGTHDGGMHAVLRRIAAGVGKATGRDYNDLDAIGRGIVTGEFRIAGHPFDLSPLVASAMSVQAGATHAIKNAVGVGTDIDNIVVVGGAADFWRDAIQRQFPRHRVQVRPEPMFANARGFLLAGEHLLNRGGVMSWA